MKKVFYNSISYSCWSDSYLRFCFFNRNEEVNNIKVFTSDTKVYDVINNAFFEGFGNLLFPVDRTIIEI